MFESKNGLYKSIRPSLKIVLSFAWFQLVKVLESQLVYWPLKNNDRSFIPLIEGDYGGYIFVFGKSICKRKIEWYCFDWNQAVEAYISEEEEGVVFKIDFEAIWIGIYGLCAQVKEFGNRWRRWMQGGLRWVDFFVFLKG